MATTNISTEIVSITGVTAHAASDEFIVSAQKFVAASVPKELLKWAASLTTASSHGGNTSQGVNIVMPTATDSILDVSRNGFSATEVPYGMKGFIANTSSLHLATNTYPKYYLDNAVTDKGTIVIVKPVPTDSETARVLYVDYTKIDDDCDLRDAVVYRACSSEFSKLATAELPTVSIAAVPPDVPTISASTISFSATAPSYTTPTTTISGTGWSTAYPDEHSAINTALAAITTEVGLAKTEVAEIVTQTLLVLGEADSEAQVNTAIVLLLAAVAEAEIASGKFVPGTSDSQFDTNATWDATNSQLTRVKDALDKVVLLIDGNKPASNYDSHDLLQTEDLELLQGNLSIVQAEIQRAQMHLQEWVSVGDMRAKHVNSALAEADGQAKVIQTHLQQAQTKREESQARLAAGGAFLQEAQAYIAQAGGYAAEVNARGGFTGAKYRAVQGYLETANGYANEVQALLGQTPMKVSEYQAKLQDALNEFNDDNAEYQAQLQISIQNAQMEDAEESKKLQKYSAELQQYASEVQSEVSEYQSKLQKQQVIEKEADKYYQWSVNCVTMYVQNNSKMIASTMASRGAQA